GTREASAASSVWVASATTCSGRAALTTPTSRASTSTVRDPPASDGTRINSAMQPPPENASPGCACTRPVALFDYVSGWGRSRDLKQREVGAPSPLNGTAEPGATHTLCVRGEPESALQRTSRLPADGCSEGVRSFAAALPSVGAALQPPQARRARTRLGPAPRSEQPIPGPRRRLRVGD